ncbi:MAG: hypothetical protein ACXWCS_28070 [Burkholderiales bacterium]
MAQLSKFETACRSWRVLSQTDKAMFLRLLKEAYAAERARRRRARGSRVVEPKSLFDDFAVADLAAIREPDQRVDLAPADLNIDLASLDGPDDFALDGVMRS